MADTAPVEKTSLVDVIAAFADLRAALDAGSVLLDPLELFACANAIDALNVASSPAGLELARYFRARAVQALSTLRRA